MENLFSECYTVKGNRVKVKTLQKYADKCDKVTWGCDEMKLISQSDTLSTCPCFQKIVFNGTNSKDVSLSLEQFEDCVFENVTITLDVFESCLLYKVLWTYESKTYDLIDFRFYSPESKKVKVNWYVSDILIHWKAWRLQVVSWWKFNIYDFITSLVSYDVQCPDRYLVALEEYYITRFDFRIDFFHDNSIPHLNYDDVYSPDARSKVEKLVIDRHSKKIYTWWTAWNRKIKNVYTRMYQKQVEALDKWHWELYIDYLEYPWKVWRLEFEFGSKFTTYWDTWTRHFSLSDEYLNHELTKKVYAYIWLSEHNWYYTKPKNKIEVPFNSLSLHQKKRIITQIKNNVRSLHKAWINPYVIVNEWIKEGNIAIDSQYLETMFEDSIRWESYSDIMSNIESVKTTNKEYYDIFYKSQLGVDQ